MVKRPSRMKRDRWPCFRSMRRIRGNERNCEGMRHLRKVSPKTKLDLKSSPVDIRTGIMKPWKAKNNRSGRVKGRDQKVDDLKGTGREQKICRNGMGNKAMRSWFAIKQTELDGNRKLRRGQGQGGKKSRIDKIGRSCQDPLLRGKSIESEGVSNLPA